LTDIVGLEPKLLVATPLIDEGVFEKSVVLVVDHSDEGALGFILNKPSNYTADQLIDQTALSSSEHIPDGLPAWIGGPVAEDNALILYKPQAYEWEMQSVVAISSHEKILKDMVRSFEKAPDAGSEIMLDGLKYPYRLMIGYAGWGPGQLEAEINNGAWIEADLDEDLIFNSSCTHLWTHAMSKMGLPPFTVITNEPGSSYIN
jgi:putative transcriptional regulator